MENLVLYILMRTDLDSLNPGKAMAQANHAYGALKKAMRVNIAMQQHFLSWMSQTDQEFGTTIVLGGSEGEINYAIRQASTWLARKDVVWGWVHDPTYPISDGKVTHLMPMDTCAFIFGNQEDIKHVTRHLTLHP